MNATLSKALVALVPAGILFVGSVLLFLRERTLGSFLQPLGAGCLVVVILTHVFEALHLLPWMQWGSNHSVGHYLDLGSAVLHAVSYWVLASCAYQAPRIMCRRIVQRVVTDAPDR